VEFEKQKPVSDEYRENWERLYANGCPILSSDVVPGVCDFCGASYEGPSGCLCMDDLKTSYELA